jgi:four helix bundle protein
MTIRQAQLENRLIDFAVSILELADNLPVNKTGDKTLKTQIAKSRTSSALNYGEAQSAESRKDFIHKMRICLKELRETNECIMIIQKRKNVSQDITRELLDENNQLISIFVKSINTASQIMTK